MVRMLRLRPCSFIPRGSHGRCTPARCLVDLNLRSHAWLLDGLSRRCQRTSGPEVFDVLGFGEEDLPVGDFAVEEPEGVAVLGVEPLCASSSGDAGACDEVLVVGEHGHGRELDGPRGFVSQASEGFDEALDAAELAGDSGATGDPVDGNLDARTRRPLSGRRG